MNRSRWGCVALALGVLLEAQEPDAFCGFYVAGSSAQLNNRATSVALLRAGTRTVLSMQNNYEGPPENFAMVIPVPVVLQRENVRVLDRSVFERLETIDAPRLVEYWEQDPCQRPERPSVFLGLGSVGSGWGGGGDVAPSSLGVRIESRFDVGEYDVVVLSAQDSAGLETWLQRENYRIPTGASTMLAPYVRQGMKFFVARVNVQRVQFQGTRAVLSPLRVHYDSETFSLPVRLGLVNSPGQQELVVHLLGINQRFEVANRPNVSIPTNLEVQPAVRERFGEFYNALFDRTLAQVPNAVVTEYAWQANSCDPCTGPTLDASDLYALGGEVLPASALPTSPAMQTAQQVPAMPTVREEAPQVTGSLNAEVVRFTIHERITRFRRCYEEELTRNPSAQGRVVLSWGIDTNGSVTTVAVQPTAGLEAVGTCMRNALVSYAFPVRVAATASMAFSFFPPPPMGRTLLLPSQVTLTRLHTRYGRELSDDLVFRVGAPITGGRQIEGAPPLALLTNASLASSNNFQARYILRHPWTGPVRCAHPRRGIWGANNSPGNRPATARDLAFQNRGNANGLSSLLRSPLPTAVVIPSQ